MRRSDLAAEAAETLVLNGKKLPPEGIRQAQHQRCGFCVSTMEVRSAEASAALGKPIGRYVTVDLRPYEKRRRSFFPHGVQCLAEELRPLLPCEAQRAVLVAGLGNRRLTADAVGPLALESLLVTRHLPCGVGQFVPVMALHTGVVGQTGMETQELLGSVVQRMRPSAVIVVDALAARNRDRLCTTVQMCDTGLTPGSGVGNHRCALTEETLGVPVVAVGVPTVMEDTSSGAQAGGEALFITPRDIDSRVAELSRLIGYGITLSLQPQMSVEEITCLLG